MVVYPLTAAISLALNGLAANPATAASRPAEAGLFVDVGADLVRLGICGSNVIEKGTADSTASIQAAVDFVAQRGPGAVFLPPGVYHLSSITIRPGVTLAGAGADRTTLRGITTSYALVRMEGGIVAGLTAYGTPDESVSGPYWKPGPCGRRTQGASKPAHVLAVLNAHGGALITNVRAMEARYDCLYVCGSKGLRVLNSQFDRAGRNVVSLVGNDEDFLFDGCRFGSLWGLYLFDIEPGRDRWVRDGMMRDCVFDGTRAGEMGTATWGNFLCFSGHAQLKTRDIRVVGCRFRDVYVRVRGVFPRVWFLWNRFETRGPALVRIPTNPTGELADAVLRGNTFLVADKPSARVIDGVAFSGDCVVEGNTPVLAGCVATRPAATQRAWEEDK
jgi:hypothetical protein